MVTFTFDVPAELDLGEHTATLTGDRSGSISDTFQVTADEPAPGLQVATGGAATATTPWLAGGFAAALSVMLGALILLKRRQETDASH